jgi:2-oxoglutarate ferredoxin oxidoreductase subunit gamma
MLIYEEDLVTPSDKPDQKQYGVPSTRIAEELGRIIVQNIVMLGFFSAASKVVEKEKMRAAVENSVPPGTETLNLRAFDAGWEHFEVTYEGKKKEEPAAADS